MSSSISSPISGTSAWRELAHEEAIDPARPIIDPHHHLWPATDGRPRYLLADLWDDTGTGHAIERTVFVECRAGYRSDGPEHLKPVGEAEFVARIARASRDGGGGAMIAGFVGHTDLRQDIALLREVFQAQEAVAQGLFRGIRHSGARDPNPQQLSILGRGAEGQYANADFRRGVALLGELGYTSYNVYWNAMKKIAARYSADEQHAMFYGTAQRVYRLP